MTKYKFFYIPGLYTVDKRMTTGNKKAGLFCYHIIPTLFLYMVSSNCNTSSIIDYILLLVMFYTLYETGYIYNDTETVKREKEPSLRLDTSEMGYYNNNRRIIYLFRLILSFILSVCIILHGGLRFALSMGLMFLEAVIFFAYNNLRGRSSLPVFFILEMFKYLPFALVVPENADVLIFIITMCIYPIPNTIERLAFRRYGFTTMINALPTKKSYLLFRIIYNFTVFFILAVLSFTDIATNIYYILFLFMLLFRITAYMLSPERKLTI